MEKRGPIHKGIIRTDVDLWWVCDGNGSSHREFGERPFSSNSAVDLVLLAEGWERIGRFEKARDPAYLKGKVIRFNARKIS